MGVKEANTESMKIGVFGKLNKVLYIWFRQQQQFAPRFFIVNSIRMLASTPFSASTGLNDDFAKWHNLQSNNVQSKRGSADIIAACEFQYDFEKVFDGLQYCLLPQLV